MVSIDNYLFASAFLGIMTERTLHLMLLWARPGILGYYTQFGRYAVAAVGLIVSGVAIGMPIGTFGLHAVIGRLGDYYDASHFFGVVAWAVAGIHVLQIVASLVMPVWWYFHPARFLRREYWFYGVPIEDPRFMERYMRSADRALTYRE